MKLGVKILLVIGASLLVVAGYCHLYEARSQGLLPVMSYPLRQYAWSLLILGTVSLFSASVVHKLSSGDR